MDAREYVVTVRAQTHNTDYEEVCEMIRRGLVLAESDMADVELDVLQIKKKD